MIRHTELGETSFKRSRSLKLLVDEGQICFGGNSKLKIYGRLDCKSGKRMRADNRVFFATACEAEENGYRPCGHCMQEAYRSWKDTASVQSVCNAAPPCGSVPLSNSGVNS